MLRELCHRCLVAYTPMSYAASHDNHEKINSWVSFASLMGTGIHLVALWAAGALLNNGNRTEWSPIRSVIIRVINKIGRPRSGSPIC